MGTHAFNIMETWVNEPVNIIYIILVTNAYCTRYTETSIYIPYIHNSVHPCMYMVQVSDIYLCTPFLKRYTKRDEGKLRHNVQYKLNFKIKIVVFSDIYL